MLEECGPTIQYIKGTDNGASDSLRILTLINYGVTDINIITKKLTESYCFNKLDGGTLPLTHQMIDKYQCKDKELVDKLKRANDYTKYFCGG